LTEHPAAVRGDEVPTCVGPNSEVSCVLAITMGCAPPFEIEIKWEDDSGMNRIYHGTLTFLKGLDGKLEELGYGT